MSKYPLVSALPKFVIRNCQNQGLKNSFFSQPGAKLFTPIDGFDVLGQLVKEGKISAEFAAQFKVEQEYEMNTPGVLFPLEEGQEATPLAQLAAAMQPYFNFRTLVEAYSNSIPSATFNLAKINESLGLANLLAHLALDDSIPEEQWVLIAEDSVMLHTEWQARLEALLGLLAFESPYLQEIAGGLETLKAQHPDYNEQQKAALESMRYCVCSLQKNRQLFAYDKDGLADLRIYNTTQIAANFAEQCAGILSPQGEQFFEISNMYNYHEQNMILVRKRSINYGPIGSKIRRLKHECNNGDLYYFQNTEEERAVMLHKQVLRPQFINFAVKEEERKVNCAAFASKYGEEVVAAFDQVHDYSRCLLPALGVNFFKDSIQHLINFTPNAIGYANPFLAFQIYNNGGHNYSDASFNVLSGMYRDTLGYDSRTGELTAQGYDYLATMPKYVLVHPQANEVARFFNQQDTDDFQIYQLPQVSQWDKEQVEQSYFTPMVISQNLHVVPNNFNIEQSLGQRNLLWQIAHDSSIGDDDFVLLAKDYAIFNDNWYTKLNHALTWMLARYPTMKMLIAGAESAEFGLRPVIEEDWEAKKELLHNGSIMIPAADWMYRLSPELEIGICNSFNFIDYSLILLRKSAIVERLGADYLTQRQGYNADNYASLFNFGVGDVGYINPQLANSLYQPRIKQLNSTAQGSSLNEQLCHYNWAAELPQQQDGLQVGGDYHSTAFSNQQVALTNYQALLSEQTKDLVFTSPASQAAQQFQQVISKAAVAPEGTVDLTREGVFPATDKQVVYPYVPDGTDTSAYTTAAQEELVEKQPWFFGKEKPLLSFVGQQSEQVQEVFNRNNPELTKTYSLAAGFKQDLVARVRKYVINLPQSTDRLTAFMQMPHVHDFIVHEAVLGRELSDEVKNTAFNVSEFHGLYKRTMHAGEYGCALSHTQVLRKALYDPTLDLDDWVLIVEDDTKLHPDWYQRLNQVLLYVNEHLPQVQILNGAQNQLQHFRQLSPEEFTSTHSIYSAVDLYHQITPQLGIGLIKKDFPAGAGFYLIKKRCLVANAQVICGAIRWVADDFFQYLRFRSEIFAYTNPQLGYDDNDLESLLNAERIANLEKEKAKLRAIPITNPRRYIMKGHKFVIQQSLSMEEINAKFPGFTVIPFVDYAAMSQEEQEKRFNFAKFRETYGREITPEELNLTLAHHAAWEKIRDLKMSNFTFHLVVEDTTTLHPNHDHLANCLCEYIDTRLDLDTLMIQTSNSHQAADFTCLPYAQWQNHEIYVAEDKHYQVNEQQLVGITYRKINNGSGSYITLKFVPAHMHYFIPDNRPFYLAGDYVLAMPFTNKSLAFAQPQLAYH